MRERGPRGSVLSNNICGIHGIGKGGWVGGCGGLAENKPQSLGARRREETETRGYNTVNLVFT